MPWVNLTQQEVDELRAKKYELTEYGKQRLKQLMNNQEPYPDAMFEEAERRERVLEIAKNFIEEHSETLEQLAEIERKEFYRFFAVEYFATGEGMSYWLKVCRNYQPYDDRDRDLERFVKFIGVGAEHYIQGLTMPTEEEFMTQYANLIPPYIVKMIERRDQPGFDWETHFYFNYS